MNYIMWFNFGLWSGMCFLTWGGWLKPSLLSQGIATFIISSLCMVEILSERDERKRRR
jgi:hypothetical protein